MASSPLKRLDTLPKTKQTGNELYLQHRSGVCDMICAESDSSWNHRVIYFTSFSSLLSNYLSSFGVSIYVSDAAFRPGFGVGAGGGRVAQTMETCHQSPVRRSVSPKEDMLEFDRDLKYARNPERVDRRQLTRGAVMVGLKKKENACCTCIRILLQQSPSDGMKSPKPLSRIPAAGMMCMRSRWTDDLKFQPACPSNGTPSLK